MDQSKEDTAVPVPAPPRREWHAPVLTQLPATLTANGGFDVEDFDGEGNFST
jgi:hypothetical protein